MAWQQCWLIFAVCVLSALDFSGSARSSYDDGICTRVRKVKGTTPTYCEVEKGCERVCCRGWRRDPDSRKLRCIKIDPNGPTNLGAMDITSALGSAEDYISARRVWNLMRKSTALQQNVCCRCWRRDPDSRKLRCIKIDPNDPTNLGAMDITSGLDSAKDYISARRVRNVMRKNTALQQNVRQSREAPPASENTPGRSSANNDQSGLEASSNRGSDTNLTRSPSQTGSVSAPNAVNGMVSSANSSTNKTPGAPISKSPTTNAEGSGKLSGSVAGPSVQNEQGSQSGDGRAEMGTVQSNQSNSSGLAAPASNDASPSLLPSEHLNSSTIVSSTQRPVTSSTDAMHTSTEKPNPPSTSGVEGSGRSRESLMNEPAAPSGQSIGVSGQDQGQPPVPPVVTQPESKNSASNSSAIVHSEAGSQTPAKTDRGDQLGDNSQKRGPETPVDKSVATSPNAFVSATTTTVSQPPVPTNAPKVQAVLSTSPPSAPTATTAPPVVATSTKSTGPESPVGQSSSGPSANSHVISAPEHSDQSASSAEQSTPTSLLTITPDELARGKHEETVLPTSALQTTNAPPIATNSTTTGPPIPARTSTNAPTGSGALPPQVVTTTHPVQNETGNNTVPTGPPVHGTATSTSTTTAPSISHGGTTPTSVANATAVPPLQHPNDTAGKTNNSSGNTSQVASPGNSSVITGQQGGASAANTTEKKDKVTIAVNCTGEGPMSNCTGVNCSHPENREICRGSYDTIPIVMPQASTAPPVAKPLDEEPHGGSSVPSGSSASKTASEVTISLLVVAAVGFVAALLYWRRRRRDRSYINYGTREPNLHFSNPVYNLEALMEQTSLVKLQDAAAMEDGDLGASDLEAASQRK